MPKLTDPGEMEIIRNMYFSPPIVKNVDVEPDELADRVSRRKIVNQAR